MELADIQRLAEDIIKAIADHPDDLRITPTNDEDERGPFTTLTVSLNDADRGACIGEQGKMAEALRRIIGLISFRRMDGARVFLRIEAPPRKVFQPEAYRH